VFRRFTVKAGALLFFAVCALAAENGGVAGFSGIWTGTMTDRNGDPQDLSFRFTQSGNVLKGKMYGDNESLAVTGVKVSGKELSFSVTTELNGQVTTFLYTGIISGNEMEVSRTRLDLKPPEPKQPDTKAGNSASKSNPPQTFRLKRLT